MNEKQPEQDDRARADAVVKAIMKRLNILTGSMAFLLIMLIVVAGFAWTQAQNNKDSLCALRENLEAQVAQGEQFLNNPEDFPQFNDPKTIALSKAQIDAQKTTIKALSGISCD